MPETVRTQVGEIRPSQLLREFGVGAVIDLPNLSVMVMGLEDWDGLYQQPQEVSEDRLRLAVQQWLGTQVTRLRTPPVSPPTPPGLAFTSPLAGVPVAAFPRWMVCPYCHLLAPVDSGLFQLKTVPYRPDRSRYVHINCTKPGQPTPVLPARYITACEYGHVDDFPWIFYVHKGTTDCTARLTLREAGFSSDVADVWVRCETCGATRSMAQAFGKDAAASMPKCRGRHPHLRTFTEAVCPERLTTLLLGASNSWFPLVLQALSVPREVDPLTGLIDLYWVQLEKARTLQDVTLMRSLGLIPLLARSSDEEVWSAIEARREGIPQATENITDLKAPEWRVFTQGNDVTDHPFFRVRNTPPPAGFEHLMERVVLADRVRQVNALIGFTRLSSLDDLSETQFEQQEMRERLTPLSRKAPTWVPTYEVHGEGIFLQFREAAIRDWMTSHPALRQRSDEFRVALSMWRQKRHLRPEQAQYPTLRYVLLHSFSHALMRQLALEAGYSMASLSERIYSRTPEEPDGPMAGVLIYTSAPDSEGTLGGLVRLGTGDELAHHIHAALESIRWCASDPLCASHGPSDEASSSLHAAACHACLFAPETSCERGNRYLDRSVLVPTIEHNDMAFFAP